MEARRTLHYALAGGESLRLLAERGSTILVAGGRITLRRPFGWLAETVVAAAMVLEAEEAWVADAEGWIDLVAAREAEVVVIPPLAVPFWRRVGRCLEGWFGEVPATGSGLAADGRMNPPRLPQGGALSSGAESRPAGCGLRPDSPPASAGAGK